MRSIRSVVSVLSASLLALAARPVTGAEPACQKWDLEVTCSTNPSRVIVTDPFTATVTVRNSGDVALTKVTVQLRGDIGAHTVAGAASPVQTVIDKLEPGESKQLSGVFASDSVGMTRVLGGARDGEGWAAANCACTVDVIGLPAIQSEMTDKDEKGVEKGIFVVGETFLYELTVQNDVGTTVTPDLKAIFTLPKELEFVSGKADMGATITGSGQTAESSAFVLTPNQVVKMTVVVKAVSAPATNFVQFKASIQTAGGIEVAEETESSTVKN